MREEKKILIYSVLNHLKDRDPAWAHVNMLQQFKTLYQCWAAACVRHHKHAKFYYSVKWRQGWLPRTEFLEFLNYAMQ
jgi:hypothetical protein